LLKPGLDVDHERDLIADGALGLADAEVGALQGGGGAAMPIGVRARVALIRQLLNEGPIRRQPNLERIK
jgi:hypothetical protein